MVKIEVGGILFMGVSVVYYSHRYIILVGNLLKALWGGHTAALQFMLGIQLQVGERKHAIRDR